MASLEHLPNPLTPMAFLPPDLAYELTILSYVLVGALVIQIWDVGNNLGSDYKMVANFGIGLPTITYFVSRFSSLAYLISAAIFQTAPIGHCDTVIKINGLLFCIAIPSTSLLFFFRVRAMYNSNKLVVAFFFLMWLAIIPACIAAILGVSVATKLGPTEYCINKATIKSYVSASAIISLVNDSLIFIAISWRLMKVASVEDPSLKDGAKIILFGKYLPNFSKALLQDGQIYYLSTINLTFITVVIFYIDAIPNVYRSIFSIPNIALINVMACRVFRRTKFGAYRRTISITSDLTLTIPSGRTGPSPIAFRTPRSMIATLMEDTDVAPSHPSETVALETFLTSISERNSPSNTLSSKVGEKVGEKEKTPATFQIV